MAQLGHKVQQPRHSKDHLKRNPPNESHERKHCHLVMTYCVDSWYLIVDVDWCWLEVELEVNLDFRLIYLYNICSWFGWIGCSRVMGWNLVSWELRPALVMKEKTWSKRCLKMKAARQQDPQKKVGMVSNFSPMLGFLDFKLVFLKIYPSTQTKDGLTEMRSSQGTCHLSASQLFKPTPTDRSHLHGQHGASNINGPPPWILRLDSHQASLVDAGTPLDVVDDDVRRSFEKSFKGCNLSACIIPNH